MNNFGKHAEIQAKAVDDNLKQTQELTAKLTDLMATARARAERAAEADDMSPPSEATVATTPHIVRGPNA